MSGPLYTQAKCESPRGACYAPIIWTVTQSGANMPLDYNPIQSPVQAEPFVALFEIELSPERDDEIKGYPDEKPHTISHLRSSGLFGETYADLLARGVELRSSHFATCPFAAQHSGKGRRR